MPTYILEGVEQTGGGGGGGGGSVSAPTHVQTLQQMVLDEVDQVNSTKVNMAGGNAVVMLFEKNMLTGYASTAPGGIATIRFKFPILIARVAVASNPIGAAFAIQVTDVGGAVTVQQCNENFTPIMAIQVAVLMLAHPMIMAEIIIMKVIEVKGSMSLSFDNTPKVPLFVEAPQQIVLEEIDTVTSTIPGATAGTIDRLFDKSMATSVTYAGAGVEGLIGWFNTPELIARVGVRGGLNGVRTDIVIDVMDIHGNSHRVYDGSAEDPALTPGIDSDNFKDLPAVDTYIPQPASPIMAVRVMVSTLVPGPIWDMSEVTIMKVIETKDFIYNEPSEPVFTQEDGQICNDEIYWKGMVLAAGSYVGNPKSMFDKNPSTVVTLSAGCDLYLPFNTPHIISKLVIIGTLTSSTIYLRDVDGFDVALCSNLSRTPGWESNIERRNAIGIRFVIGGQGSAVIFATVLQKSKETPVVVEVPNTILFNEINSESASFTPLVDWTDPTLERLFDRKMWPQIIFTFNATPGVLTIDNWMPQLITRIMLNGGQIPIGTTIEVKGIDDTYTTIFTSTVVKCCDTGNFPPAVIKGVRFTFPATARMTELVIWKAGEVKSYSLAPEIGLLEFYGQRVSYDRLEVDAGGQPYEYENYLLLRRALETDADNDPTVNNDSTVVTMTSDIVDSQRIMVRFYVPTDDIRSVRHHVTALATVEVGSNARCTSIRYRIVKVNLTTSTLTALSAVKTVTFPALSFDGATSRAVRAILQDLYAQDIAQHEVLVLEIAVWGRQVASVATPAPITLWHRRGLGDCKLDVECLTDPSPPSPP